MNLKKKFLNGLASLKQKEFVRWHNELAKENPIPRDTLKRWKKLDVPYEELPEIRKLSNGIGVL